MFIRERALASYRVKHGYVTCPNRNHGLDPVCNAKVRQLFIEYAEAYLK